MPFPGIRIASAKLNSPGVAWGGSACGGADSECHGFFAFDIQAKESSGSFNRRFILFVAMATGLSFGVAMQMMRVNSQELSRIMATGPAYAAQSYLQRFGFSDGMRSEQVMDCMIAGYEAKAVGEFESFLA